MIIFLKNNLFKIILITILSAVIVLFFLYQEVKIEKENLENRIIKTKEWLNSCMEAPIVKNEFVEKPIFDDIVNLKLIAQLKSKTVYLDRQVGFLKTCIQSALGRL